MLNELSVKHLRTKVCFLFISNSLYTIAFLIFLHIFGSLIYLNGNMKEDPGPQQKSNSKQVFFNLLFEIK